MSFVDNGMAGLSERLEKTLLRLPGGYYLLGLGPYNAGLVRLDFDELLIGREVPEFIGVGMPVSGFRVSSPDAFLNTEVSRLHAKLFRLLLGSTPQYRLVDMRSTCGTYLNGDPIPVPDDLAGLSEQDCARPLRSGDFFSLGRGAKRKEIAGAQRSRAVLFREAGQIIGHRNGVAVQIGAASRAHIHQPVLRRGAEQKTNPLVVHHGHFRLEKPFR